MKKVLVACGNGVGSSLIVKMKVQKVFGDLSIPCEITHSSVGQAKSEASKYDFIVVSKMFEKEFESVTGPKVIALLNILSEDELKEKLNAAMA